MFAKITQQANVMIDGMDRKSERAKEKRGRLLPTDSAKEKECKI